MGLSSKRVVFEDTECEMFFLGGKRDLKAVEGLLYREIPARSILTGILILLLYFYCLFKL